MMHDNYELERDLETLRRMTELKKQPKRLKAAQKALDDQKKTISSLADLKKAKASYDEGERTDLGNGEIAHFHEVEVDVQGNGKTTMTSTGPAHHHEVVANKIQPGGKDQHMHKFILEDMRENEKGGKERA